MGSYLPSRTYALVLAIFFTLMIVFAAWLLFEASGYQIFYGPLRIVKTGLISLTVHPNDQLTISLNGQAMPKNQTTFMNLPAGRYQVLAQRPDYLPWEITTELMPGEAESYGSVLLFLKKPISTMIESIDYKVYESVLSHPERFQAGLQFFENEVWANEQLVTRYSEPIKQAMWLPDNSHLLIQLADGLHVVERTGGHDITLVTSSTDDQISRFAPLAGGEKIVIQSARGMQLLEITAPFQRVALPSL